MTDNHDPSIRTGESVSDLEQFIAEYQFDAFSNSGESVSNAVSVYRLREFMKGKVLVDADALADLKAEITVIACRKEAKGDCKGAELLNAICQALHPTSSGAGTRQDNEEPEEGALDDLSDVPIWLRKPHA